MIISKEPLDLVNTFRSGGVIAYPTEAIYGFGCDPDNQSAVQKLLEIKKRPITKGLILVASDFSQVEKYLQAIPDELKKYTLPSSNTYIFPALTSAPKWLTGEFNTLAIRISKHPLVIKLCETFDSAIISTSANFSGEDPAINSTEVRATFSSTIDAILDGDVGGSSKPSTIIDTKTGNILRN